MQELRPTRSRRYVAAVTVALAIALAASGCSSADVVVSPSAPGTAPGTTRSASTADTVGIGGGRSIYVECQGTGSPTVVLQSGFGNAGDIWTRSDTGEPAVFPTLAESNRVCLYDRPGSVITTTSATGTPTKMEGAVRGRSGSAAMPRDPAEVVTELHDVLAAADIPGPYVLVGHSLGGAFNVLYARTYPDEVSALVVVDSPLPPAREIAGTEAWERAALMSIDPGAVPGYELESYDNGVLFDEIEGAGPLPDVPVIVVRRSGPKMSDDPIPEGAPLAGAIEKAQWEGQAAWASGVPGAEVITVEGTTHYIQNQRPDAVVDAVRAVIARS